MSDQNLVKQSTDSDFSLTFGKLAHSQLKDKAPTLLQYLLGFQVIDKNEEETRAVGIFGFKVGETLLYVPIFFLNGNIKGLDLLYVKDQDMFVPLQENWIDYLLRRKPTVLGEAAPADILSRVTAPNLTLLTQSPKTAAVIDDPKYAWILPEFRPGLEMFISPVEKLEKRSAEIRDLPTFLAENGLLSDFIEGMTKNAHLCEAVMSFYSIDDFKKAVELPGVKANVDMKKYPVNLEPSPEAGVAVIEKDDAEAKNLLSEPQKEELLRDGYVVLDERQHTAQVYKGDYERQLSNPEESGIYDMLTGIGSFSPVIVIKEPKTFGRPAIRYSSVCLVIDGKKAANFVSSDVFTKKQYIGQKLVDELKDKPWAKAVEVDKFYAFMNSNGDGTFPFKVLRKQADPDGSVQLWVRPVYNLQPTSREGRGRIQEPVEAQPATYAGGRRRVLDSMLLHQPTADPTDQAVGLLDRREGGSYQQLPSSEDGGKDGLPYAADGRHVIISPNDSSTITHSGGSTFVPGNFKAIPISSKMEDIPEPGTMANMYMALKQAAHDVSLFREGQRLHLKKDGENQYDIKPVKAAFYLAANLGISANLAKELVKEAVDKGRTRFWVEKQAGSVPLYDQNISYDPTLGYPTSMPYNQEQKVNPGRAWDVTPFLNRYGPHSQDHLMPWLNSAAQKGQKEVFDSGVISGLIRINDSIDKVADYQKDIILGMDRVGRILFLYYWHNDDFAEKYGKQDMVELEDTLRNVFRSLGDLVIFLKKKSVDSVPDASNSDLTSKGA